MRPLLSHATLLEDVKGDAGQLETPPSCRGAVEQSGLCPDLQVRKAAARLHFSGLILESLLNAKVKIRDENRFLLGKG